MDKMDKLLDEILDMHMHGPLNRDEYKKLVDLVRSVAGEIEDDKKALEAAKADIAELLWLNGNCEYCAYGEELKFGDASKWSCLLDAGCCPKWRGIQQREEEPEEEEDVDEGERAPDPGANPAKHLSRTERLFGARESWAAQAQEAPTDERGAADDEPQESGAKKYTGFLYLRCGRCGKLRGFCAKTPISEYICRDCGGVTPLRKLTAMHVRCKCGSKFKYRTNLTEDSFTYDCLTCHAPVDIVFNLKKNAYTPL